MIFFSGANSAGLAASLDQNKFHKQEQTGILAHFIFALAEIFREDFREHSIQISNRKLCQVATL
jgi:hypothetical protein